MKNYTLAEWLDWLELPENEEQIEHLSHFTNLRHLDELGEMRGFKGFVARSVLFFTRKHVAALEALSLCENVDDIRAFKSSRHYDKLKNMNIGGDIGDLSELRELKELKELRQLRDL